MASPISATPSTPAPGAPQLRPEGQRDVAAEHALTDGALHQLGTSTPAPFTRVVAQLPGTVGVPVGTPVHAQAGDEPWTVIGSTQGKLDVARNTSGTLERMSAPFASFAKFTQDLLQSPATIDGRTGASMVAMIQHPSPAPSDATDHMWIPTTSSRDAVATSGPAAKVLMVDASELSDPAHARDPKFRPTTFETTWDDVLKSRNADKLWAVALEPNNVDDAIALRKLVGDDRFVTSSVGVHDKNDRERLVGTNSEPGSGTAALDYVQKTVDWFRTKAGVNVLPKGTPVVMHENNPDYLANASAGVSNGVVNINEGPQDEALRQRWLNAESGKLGQVERKINKQIRERHDTVLNHEWGHALRGQTWGEVFPKVQRAEDLSPAQAHEYVEHSMVNEAMSDLYGVAKGEHVDFGIRKVGTTQNQSATLDRYRALLARTPMDNMDVHFGTQLVSKPPLAVAKTHGFDALAEITGAADTDISHQMKSGAIDVVSVPTAATALYAAAARRFGLTDPAVVEMRNEWQQLGVHVPVGDNASPRSN